MEGASETPDTGGGNWRTECGKPVRGFRGPVSWCEECDERLKGDRDTILESYADLTVEALDALSPEQRNRLYKTLKLNVVLGDDGTPEVSGALCGSLEILGDETSYTKNDIPAALSV